MAHSKTVVFVTGATRGIGKATAECLASDGFVVYGGARSCSEIEGAQYVELDATSDVSVKSAVEEVIGSEGQIDAVVLCAGVGVVGAVERCSIDDFKRQMDVNFYGVIRVCHEVIPHMRMRGGGRIVVVGSTNGVVPAPYASAYSASKAALEALVECLSVELMPWGIEVAIVEPGFVQTRFSFSTGERRVWGGPYREVDAWLEAHLKERGADPSVLKPSQTAGEVASFIESVLREGKLQLRYQTSREAEDVVRSKLSDVNGDVFFGGALKTLKRLGVLKR